MVAQRSERIASITAIFAEPGQDLEAQLVSLTHLLGEIADQGPAFAGPPGEFALHPMRSPATRRAVASQMRGQADELERLLAGVLEIQGVGPGVSTRAVTTVVLALVQGLVRRRRLDPSSVDDEVIAQALRWLFAGIA